ncbi:MAG: beta-xylosidase [Myxococcota bacterium]|nr:beta-xylosidase [Myxococcota bacterium]
MPRRITQCVSACVAGLGLASGAAAQGRAVTIDVEATAPGTPLERVWSYFGYDEANYTTTPEGEELLRTLAAANTARVFVRTHFLFNTGDGTPGLKWGSTNLYTEDAAGRPVYDYTLIDRITDAMTGAGALPFVELGFMPQALSVRPEPYQNSTPYTLDGGSFYPPRDYEKWAGLVGAWATHVKERYPNAGSDWQWELWNEPDIGYWRGTFEEYAVLYDYTEAALHAVFPEAKLGGPAVASPDREFFGQFLDHCADGVNAVTGETGTRLDLVSFHAKGGVTITDDHVQMDLGNQLRLHRSGFDTVVQSAAFAGTPVVISEADPDGCAACSLLQRRENAYRSSPAYGAYEVAMMKRTLDLAAERGVDLRGVLTWAFTFPGTAYFAGYRALSTNGIHLPVLNAFKLLGSLKGVRLPLTSSGALPLETLLADGVRGEPDIDGLAAKDGSEVQVLVWNYHDDLRPAEASPVSVRIAVPPEFGARVSVTHARVDETHGDAFAVWTAQGMPATPSDAQLRELRNAMQPGLLEGEREMEVENGSVSVAFELPRFGVSLLTLAAAEEPRAPEQSDAGCSCRLAAPASASSAMPALFSMLLVMGLRRASSRGAVWGSRARVMLPERLRPARRSTRRAV